MHSLIRVIVLVIGLVVSRVGVTADQYLSGAIEDVTSGPQGLMVKLTTGVPTNCAGVGYGWMTVPEANKTMIAVALLTWQNQRNVTVYTNPLTNGVCVINQFDPA